MRRLPLQTETWAWAHAQISSLVASPTAVDGAIRANPDNSIARLISPRRLLADRDYHAFLVPAFETGRLAGLGEDVAAVPAQAPSWIAGGMPHSTVRPLEYPVYCQWSFRTSDEGDFETLVRALKPGPVGPEFGKRDVDVSRMGFGMDGIGPGTMAIEGALLPPTFSREPYPATPGAAFEDRLESLLDIAQNLEQGESIAIGHPFHVEGAPDAYGPNVPDDPIVTPPVFGKWHAGVDRLFDARNDADLAWLGELNLDPRNRAAAGLGVEVIQKRQDEFVERAWQQIGEVERANRQLRHAELAAAAADSVYQKHFVRTDSDRVIRLTAAAQKRMLAPAASITFHAAIKQSQVPAAAQVGTFKRISRPQRKTIRVLAGSGNIEGLQRNLITNLNLAVDPVTAAPPKPVPETSLDFQTVSSAVAGSIGDFATEGSKPRYFFMEGLVDELNARLSKTPPDNLATLDLAAFRAALHTRLNGRTPPVEAAKKLAVEQLIDSISAVAPVDAATVNVQIPPARFDDAFGADIAGKSYRGVTVIPSGPPRAGEISKMVAAGDLDDFQGELAAFNSDVLQARTNPPPPSPLSGLSPLAAEALKVLNPTTSIVDRVSAALGGFVVPDPSHPRRLAPVMAYPVFTDAMFEDLRSRSPSFIIPNYADLPVNTITLLKDNERFIESFMAGLNHEMARELLWREYPTDQRGTYFRAFWDTRDSANPTPSPDILPMDQWAGDLGHQSARPGGHLVLVIRGDLLRKFPTTVVYAQRAAFTGGDPKKPRILTDESVAANIRMPVFRGDLEPDISIFGFLLGEDEARGHRPTGPSDPKPADPGWFFVLKERPGEPSFGLDETANGVPALSSWNDLELGASHLPDAIAERHRDRGQSPRPRRHGQTRRPNRRHLGKDGGGHGVHPAAEPRALRPSRPGDAAMIQGDIVADDLGPGTDNPARIAAIRNRLSQLHPDGIPFLLLPVRIETRFMRVDRPTTTPPPSGLSLVDGLRTQLQATATRDFATDLKAGKRKNVKAQELDHARFLDGAVDAISKARLPAIAALRSSSAFSHDDPTQLRAAAASLMQSYAAALASVGRLRSPHQRDAYAKALQTVKAEVIDPIEAEITRAAAPKLDLLASLRKVPANAVIDAMRATRTALTAADPRPTPTSIAQKRDALYSQLRSLRTLAHGVLQGTPAELDALHAEWKSLAADAQRFAATARSLRRPDDRRSGARAMDDVLMGELLPDLASLGGGAGANLRGADEPAPRAERPGRDRGRRRDDGLARPARNPRDAGTPRGGSGAWHSRKSSGGRQADRRADARRRDPAARQISRGCQPRETGRRCLRPLAQGHR